MEIVGEGEAFRAVTTDKFSELEMLRRRVDMTYTMGAQRACMDAIEKLYAYFDARTAILLLGATFIGCA